MPYGIKNVQDNSFTNLVRVTSICYCNVEVLTAMKNMFFKYGKTKKQGKIQV